MPLVYVGVAVFVLTDVLGVWGVCIGYGTAGVLIVYPMCMARF